VHAELGWPKFLARMCASQDNLWKLIAIPATVVLLLWLISGGMHLPSAQEFATAGYQHFFGHWDWRYLDRNVMFIDMFMLAALAIAVWSFRACSLAAARSALMAARRELAEETDYEASSWHVLVDVYASPGFTTEGGRSFLARGLSPLPEAARVPREAEDVDARLDLRGDRAEQTVHEAR